MSKFLHAKVDKTSFKQGPSYCHTVSDWKTIPETAASHSLIIVNPVLTCLCSVAPFGVPCRSINHGPRGSEGPDPNSFAKSVNRASNDYAATSCHKVSNALRTVLGPPYRGHRLLRLFYGTVLMNWWISSLAGLLTVQTRNHQKSSSYADNGGMSVCVFPCQSTMKVRKCLHCYCNKLHKFGQFILRKIIRIVAITYQLLVQNAHKPSGLARRLKRNVAYHNVRKSMTDMVF